MIREEFEFIRMVLLENIVFDSFNDFEFDSKNSCSLIFLSVINQHFPFPVLAGHVCPLYQTETIHWSHLLNLAALHDDFLQFTG